MRPVILLTCGGSLPGGAPAGGGAGATGPADFGPAGRTGVKIEYARSVESAGGAPLLLPNSNDAHSTASAVAVGAGLLLTGGGDVHPDLFGQPAHQSLARVDPVRDATERAAIEEAMRRGMPILGICRGIQMLNVALGGALIQDIPTHFGPGAGLNHKGPDHPVRIEGGSALAGLWPGGELMFNSRHHQALGRLAPALKATAWAPDGIIEAVESADGYPLLALQCHPEDLADRPEFLAPFRWLIAQARAWRGSAPGRGGGGASQCD